MMRYQITVSPCSLSIRSKNECPRRPKSKSLTASRWKACFKHKMKPMEKPEEEVLMARLAVDVLAPITPVLNYEGYKNKRKTIRNFNGSISSYINGSGIIPLNISITSGASGTLIYCKSVFWWWKKCYKELNGWIPHPSH